MLPVCKYNIMCEIDTLFLPSVFVAEVSGETGTGSLSDTLRSQLQHESYNYHELRIPGASMLLSCWPTQFPSLPAASRSRRLAACYG